jgi:histidinol-phosphate phosphatase family protein
MGSRTKALILAGGVGSRLRPLTDVLPKCLVPIEGRALLDYWVDCLIESGISEARINSHAHAERVREYIGLVNSSGRLRLIESYEPKLLGSAGTVTANADLADSADEIAIIYADNLSDLDLRPLLAFHRQHGDPLTMVLFRAPNPRTCGIADLDGEGRIVSFVEKPEQPTSDLANAGVYIVDAATYREIAAMGAFDLGFDVLPKFVGRMRGWVWGGYHLDIGTPEALERARREAASTFPAPAPARASSSLHQPAIFLDRDGTVIEHVHYLSDPALVRLLPGVAEALRRFRRAGFARILVTNQSAIGRGMLTTERLDQIHAEMNRQLATHGATVDAIYYCPDAPAGDDRTLVENPERKPGPGMLLRAAADLKLDLGVSWMVGDLISDVLAGQNAGCRSILLESGQTTPEQAQELSGRFMTASTLAAAADLILANHGEAR